MEEYLNKIKTTSDEMISNFGKPVNILGCGIGAPNASSKNGTIENASKAMADGFWVPLAEVEGLPSVFAKAFRLAIAGK